MGLLSLETLAITSLQQGQEVQARNTQKQQEQARLYRQKQPLLQQQQQHLTQFLWGSLVQVTSPLGIQKLWQ
jgi:hypothetical protein